MGTFIVASPYPLRHQYRAKLQKISLLALKVLVLEPKHFWVKSLKINRYHFWINFIFGVFFISEVFNLFIDCVGQHRLYKQRNNYFQSLIPFYSFVRLSLFLRLFFHFEWNGIYFEINIFIKSLHTLFSLQLPKSYLTDTLEIFQ